MSRAAPPTTPRPPAAHVRAWGLALLLGALALAAVYGLAPLFAPRAAATDDAKEGKAKDDPKDAPKKNDEDEDVSLQPAPDIDGGVSWLNSAGPLRLKDLRGKFVLLDFWTYCCINCIHTLPDLAKLEKKYANQLVVIGVHSAKFDNEKESENIRKAVLRYEIAHPVVNDAEMKIWRRFRVSSWPTLALIDPEGRYMGSVTGEGNVELIDRVLTRYVPKYRARKTLNEKPMKFELARFQENGNGPLFFPGKVLADGPSKRLFIADSTHHRIVITDLDGKKLAVAGTGQPGLKDGPFDAAQFDDPQGLALKGTTLYVADRKNHAVRALDLSARTVKTVAGTGAQGEQRVYRGDPLKVGLNSPWDLLARGDELFIAMAGHHQIWRLDVAKGEIENYAGAGPENIRDGNLRTSLFAQPSGLATDGDTLYVADSEVSAIREVPMNGKGLVKTVVGDGLFEFGDVDGEGERVRLQHALGVVWAEGKLWIADTYNSKIKVMGPKKRSCKTFLGGEPDGWLAGPLFNEPAGLSYAGGKLYVADTNAHRIRVVDLKTKKVSTLALQGVDAPKLQPVDDKKEPASGQD